MQNQLKVSLENIIPLTEARDHFSQIVNEVQKDKLYVLTKGGKPAVAIIDVKYLEHITGGELNKVDIQEEIKKAPEKVGLPPMIEHNPPKPTPPPAPQSSFSPPKPEPKPVSQSKPFITPPINNTPPPKPAGFAAPQNAPKPEPQNITPPVNPSTSNSPTMPPLDTKPAPTPSAPPAPLETPPSTPLKTPPADDKMIDIQIRDDKPQDESSQKDKMTSLDDKSSPAQYTGGSDEPEDMSID